MAIFRFDLHVHSFFSADASSSPEALVAKARTRGLDGLVITDHDTCEAFAYCLKNGLANRDGTAVDGFLVAPGVEVSTADGHLLCIGTTLPGRRNQRAVDVEAEILESGGIAIPAHPFDHWRAGIRPRVMDTLRTPVIEGFNAAVTSRKFNVRAKAYAARRSLHVTAGSDAHHASAVGTAWTAFEMADLSVTSLVAALPRGGTLHEQYLSRTEGLKKHFGNWIRILNPKAPKS